MEELELVLGVCHKFATLYIYPCLCFLPTDSALRSKTNVQREYPDFIWSNSGVRDVHDVVGNN
jgi:hypothetical protein